MKKSFMLLLGLAVLAGCSNDDFENNGNQDGALVPIELGAGVNTLTRAVIVNNSPVIAGIAGWEADAAPDYSKSAAWNTTITTTANDQTPQTVDWTKQQYYAPGGEKTTYMKAWHPAGTLSDAKVTFTNTDGSVDALLSDVVSGSTNDKTGKNLAFKHMTSQIKFVVKKGIGLADGTEIKSIKIKDVQLPVGFDLSKSSNEEGSVTYAAANDLNIPNIQAEQEITAEGASAGDPVMIKPMSGKTFSVDIETNNATYTDRTVTVTTDNVSAGYAYTITLTFGQAGIELTATVAAWESAAGSGEIQ